MHCVVRQSQGTGSQAFPHTVGASENLPAVSPLPTVPLFFGVSCQAWFYLRSKHFPRTWSKRSAPLTLPKLHLHTYFSRAHNNNWHLSLSTVGCGEGRAGIRDRKQFSLGFPKLFLQDRINYVYESKEGDSCDYLNPQTSRPLTPYNLPKQMPDPRKNRPHSAVVGAYLPRGP